MHRASSSPEATSPGFAFASTHWSVVLLATTDSSPQGQLALETLCRSYWRPLYGYIRKRGSNHHEAEDLLQEFFRQLLEKNELPKAGPEKGRFRFFLLLRLKHFLINEWERLRAQKRGGRREIVSFDASQELEHFLAGVPAESGLDQTYDRHWAKTVVERSLARVSADWVGEGKTELFAQLRVFLAADSSLPSYEAVARLAGISEGAVKVAVHRLRQRFREVVRQEVANTVATPADVEDELRYLIEILRNG